MSGLDRPRGGAHRRFSFFGRDSGATRWGGTRFSASLRPAPWPDEPSPRRPWEASFVDSPWIFPNASGLGPLSEIQKTIQRVRRRAGIELRGHDLRRTAASNMASMGTPRFVIARILNHVEVGVTAVYDRHSYDREKREAVDAWGRRLRGAPSSHRRSRVATMNSSSSSRFGGSSGSAERETATARTRASNVASGSSPLSKSDR